MVRSREASWCAARRASMCRYAGFTNSPPTLWSTSNGCCLSSHARKRSINAVIAVLVEGIALLRNSSGGPLWAAMPQKFAGALSHATSTELVLARCSSDPDGGRAMGGGDGGGGRGGCDSSDELPSVPCYHIRWFHNVTRSFGLGREKAAWLAAWMMRSGTLQRAIEREVLAAVDSISGRRSVAMHIGVQPCTQLCSLPQCCLSGVIVYLVRTEAASTARVSRRLHTAAQRAAAEVLADFTLCDEALFGCSSRDLPRRFVVCFPATVRLRQALAFLSCRAHRQLFRHLDLRRAPAALLNDAQLSKALANMTHLEHLTLPGGTFGTSSARVMLLKGLLRPYRESRNNNSVTVHFLLPTAPEGPAPPTMMAALAAPAAPAVPAAPAALAAPAVPTAWAGPATPAAPAAPVVPAAQPAPAVPAEPTTSAALAAPAAHAVLAAPAALAVPAAPTASAAPVALAAAGVSAAPGALTVPWATPEAAQGTSMEPTQVGNTVDAIRAKDLLRCEQAESCGGKRDETVVLASDIHPHTVEAASEVGSATSSASSSAVPVDGTALSVACGHMGGASSACNGAGRAMQIAMPTLQHNDGLQHSGPETRQLFCQGPAPDEAKKKKKKKKKKPKKKNRLL
eukprot:NODE_1134_length_2593_cov_5.049473.p1 GENE.NODE_1134_length_2593_cov_5.049473~~NODE_1134_length_2593_cov_5.049473.p1  ORF type:complete len:627 (-),score=165.58 NODE_1134_length_2593_cov_5.049473:114-1994(-)